MCRVKRVLPWYEKEPRENCLPPDRVENRYPPPPPPSVHERCTCASSIVRNSQTCLPSCWSISRVIYSRHRYYRGWWAREREIEATVAPLRCKSHHFFTIYAGTGTEISNSKCPIRLTYSTAVKFHESEEDDIIVETSSSQKTMRRVTLVLNFILGIYIAMKMLENIRLFFSTDCGQGLETKTIFRFLFRIIESQLYFYIRSFYDLSFKRWTISGIGMTISVCRNCGEGRRKVKSPDTSRISWTMISFIKWIETPISYRDASTLTILQETKHSTIDSLISRLLNLSRQIQRSLHSLFFHPRSKKYL